MESDKVGQGQIGGTVAAGLCGNCIAEHIYKEIVQEGVTGLLWCGEGTVENTAAEGVGESLVDCAGVDTVLFFQLRCHTIVQMSVVGEDILDRSLLGNVVVGHIGKPLHDVIHHVEVLNGKNSGTPTIVFTPDGKLCAELRNQFIH